MPEVGKMTPRGAVCVVGCGVCGDATVVHACGRMWHVPQTSADSPLPTGPGSRRGWGVGAAAGAWGSDGRWPVTGRRGRRTQSLWLQLCFP